MASKVTKTAYCKKASFQTGMGAKSLQYLLNNAFVQLRLANSRKQAIGEDGKHMRLVNSFATVGGVLCGVLLTYERGTNVLALAEDDSAETYDVGQFLPPATDEGKRREFLEGVLYFAVADNHVAIIQSQAVRAVEFEQHVAWLIRETTSSAELPLVGLKDALSPDIEKRISTLHVKEVEFGAPLVAPLSAQADGEEDTFRIGEFAKSVLDSLGLTKSVKLKDILDEKIELSLRVRHINKVSPSAQAVVDQLAFGLRNHEGGDTVIVLNDGSTVAGSEAKLQKKMRVEASAGVLSADDAFVQLSSWLKEMIQKGEIRP